MEPILNKFPIIKFLFYKLKKNLFKVIIVFLILSLLFGLECWFESQVDQSVNNWNTLHNSLIIITGEYPDAMKSFGGRIIQLIFLIFGTLFLSAIIGSLSSFFVTEAAKNRPPTQKFKDHFIICNWNSKAKEIITQLVVGNRHNNSKKRTRILIITSSIIENQDDIIEEYHGCELYFIHDDPSHHNVLKKYGALTAKSIILLADEQTQNPDEKNALIALAVKHLEDEDDEKNTTKHGVSKDIRVIAELSDNSRSAYLTNAGADEVIGKNYSAGIIAQTAIFKGMSLMFNNLLTYSNNTNEIYFIGSDNYPENWQGQTFDELSDTIAKYYSTQANKVAVRCQCPNVASEACNKRKKCYKNSNCKINNCSLIKREKKPLLLLGIKLSDKNSHSTALSERIVLNPIREKFDKLSQGDALIIMSYNSIDKLKE